MAAAMPNSSTKLLLLATAHRTFPVVPTGGKSLQQEACCRTGVRRYDA
jgi:hypothetical protein